MKNKLLLLLSLLIAVFFSACVKPGVSTRKPTSDTTPTTTTTKPPSLDWVVQIGSNSNNLGTEINLDANANVYSYGAFQNTIDFNPGTGVYNLTGIQDIVSSSGIQMASSLYMQELDSAGKFITAVKEPAGFQIYPIRNKGADGVTFLWGTGTDTIFKYNAAGVLLSTFTCKLAPAYEEHYSGVTTDASGNLYIAGYVYLNRTYGQYNIVVNPGTFSAYLKKYDPNGNLLWSNVNLTDAITSIGVDGAGNTYGFVSEKSVVEKFGPTGSELLSTTIQKGQQADNLHFPNTMAVDNAGNCYFTGFFTGKLNFGTGSHAFYLTSGDNNAFIEKIDAWGNFKWAVQFTNVEQYQYYSASSFSSLALDNKGSIYLTGQFYGTVNFDPGTGTHTLTKAATEYWNEPATDAFVLKLNQSK